MISFVETKLFTRLVQEYLSQNIPAHVLKQIKDEIDG